MKNIKSFKLFLESYSEDLSYLLENEENNYIVMKGDDIIGGFEYLEDAFTNIGELLEGDGTLDEEQVYEFNDMVDQTVVSDTDEIVPQDEIDSLLNDVLDKFGVIEPYKVMNRIELEDTPVDASFDDEEELEDILSESVENVCIVGCNGDQMEEIDSFMSTEEAESYIEEYRKTYTEYDDMKIVHRDEMNENILFTPDSKCECKCECNCDVECECAEKGECNCSDECDCPTCKDMRSSSEESNGSNIKKFESFIK